MHAEPLEATTTPWRPRSGGDVEPVENCVNVRFAEPLGIEIDELTARRVAAALSKLGSLPAELAAAKIRTATTTGAVLQLQPRQLDAVLEALFEFPAEERTPQLDALQIALVELLP